PPSAPPPAASATSSPDPESQPESHTESGTLLALPAILGAASGAFARRQVHVQGPSPVSRFLGSVLGRGVVLEVDEVLAHELAQARDDAGLDLAHALAGHAELVAHLLERLRLLGQDPLLHDPPLPLVEALGELVDLLEEHAAPLLVGHVLLGRAHVRGNEVPVAGAPLLVAHRRIEGEVGLAEALLHVDDVFLRDVEPLGQQLRLDLEPAPLELALLTVQPEEELALGARRAEPHEADVVE